MRKGETDDARRATFCLAHNFFFFFCIYCCGNVEFSILESSSANCMIFFFLVSGFLIKSMMHPAGADLLARLVAEITLVARMGVAEHSHCRIAHHPILAALSYWQAQRPPDLQVD